MSDTTITPRNRPESSAVWKNPSSSMPRKCVETVRQTPGVDAVPPPVVLGDSGLALINVFPASAPQDKETSELLHRMRDTTVPHVTDETSLDILVAGLPGFAVDFFVAVKSVIQTDRRHLTRVKGVKEVGIVV